jgi:hypothetical protein
VNVLRKQEGASLILLIGITAALAVLVATLTALTINVSHNTARDVSQVKAFNIAEGGLETGQQALWSQWPSTPSPAPSVDTTAFRAQFPISQFPNPTTGPFIGVTFYDDNGVLADASGNPLIPGIHRQYNYDQNNNGYMWVQSTSGTGVRKAMVMALVQRIQYSIRIRENVAIVTTGALDISGTGNQPVIGLDPPATMATAYAGSYTPNGKPDLQGGVVVSTGANLATLTDVFPDEVLANLIATAHAAGKEYATAATVPTAAWSSDPRIIVIDSGGVDFKNVPDTDTMAGKPTVWSENNPGILIVLSGNVNATGQQKTVYGLVYLMDGLVLGGNAEIHGMVIAKSSVWMHGTRAVDYNQTVMNNLNRPVTLSVKLVSNTWRELNAYHTAP